MYFTYEKYTQMGMCFMVGFDNVDNTCMIKNTEVNIYFEQVPGQTTFVP